MAEKRKPPSWLLAELGFEDGVLNEDCTTVTGKPGAHLIAVLNTGSGAPDTHTADLTTLAEWKAIQRRLADEGYPES